MSLVTNIKEFADVLNTIYSNQFSSIEPAQLASASAETSLELSKSVVLQQAFIHIVKDFGSGLFYVLSFQWFRDFSYLPLLAPSVFNSSFFGDTFVSNPASHLFSLSKIGFEQNCKTSFCDFQVINYLLAGLINSCFFSLPLSLSQLVTVRRLFSQGTAAAIASIFGTVGAHSLILLGVLYGLRSLIIPYLSLEPLTFVIGLVTVVVVINELVQEKKMYLVPLKHTNSLVKILILNFILALCEETTIFHSFNHLTLNTESSFLEFSLLTNSFLLTTVYLFAFIVGHCLFSFAFCFLVLKATEQFCSLTGWTLSKIVQRINKFVLLFIVAFTFSSFPYYGLDYLFTKIGGFLPEDPFLSNTVFSPTMVRSRNTYFKSNAPAKSDEITPLELDLNYFDRGVYLNASKEDKFSQDAETGVHLDSSSGVQSNQVFEPILTFEELNYQGEYAWLMRHERARSIPEDNSNLSDTQQNGVKSFSSFFQQSKSHFKELKLKQENNQAALALKERPPLGYISKWKEGTLPGPVNALNLPESTEREQVMSKEAVPWSNVWTGSLIAKKARTKQNFVQSDETGTFTPSGHGVQNEILHTVPFSKDLLSKELTFEEEIATNYTKGFVSPFSEEAENTTPLELIPIENIIKKRYLLNPVYRMLLKTDIDTFLARQPVHYKIAENQEHSLFKKRQLLEKYYNWLRYYAPLDTALHTKSTTSLPFTFAFTNKELILPKSFVDTVYHQQFKGTLNAAKRLFKVTFASDQNPTKNRVLSYDIALYKNKRSTKENQDLTVHPALHEELLNEKVSPFIEESNSFPIYAGWDDQARRFVITNRFIARK